MDIAKLKEVFHPEDIEWRVSRAGESNGKPWAFVLAYVTNRAIMNRLDDVCSPENWKNEFTPAPNGGTLCGISVKINSEWVTKWDGSDNTNIEAVKGGLSGAMKRAAVQWGIGRYLYDLPETYAVICDNGKHYQGADPKGKYKAFKWDAPQIPGWALPGNAKPARPESTTVEHAPKTEKTVHDYPRETLKPKEDKAAVMGDVIDMIKNSGLDDEAMNGLRKKYAEVKTLEQAEAFKQDVATILMVKSAMLDGFEDDQRPFDMPEKEIPLL